LDELEDEEGEETYHGEEDLQFKGVRLRNKAEIEEQGGESGEEVSDEASEIDEDEE
jgi:hypothetical protein